MFRMQFLSGVSKTFVVSRPSCGDTCERRDGDCVFQVAWSINPHMEVGSVDGRAAVAEHDAFVRTLRAAGARVTYVPFVHGAFDSVFSKDNALLFEGRALLASPHHEERVAEQASRAAAYRELGLEVSVAPVPLEGGDVVVIPGAGDVFLGHGFRSSRDAAAALHRFTGHSVTTLELCDPRLYHLDMVLSVLDDGTALVCLEALTSESRWKIVNHPRLSRIVAVPLSEALRFGVNLVQVGSTIVWGADAPSTTRALEDLGYRMRRVSLEQFHRAGGSAACLVSRVHSMVALEEEMGPESAAA